MEFIKILIGADIVPTEGNYSMFCNQDVENLCGAELTALFANADYRILNLEAPLTNVKNPIKKNGPTLSAPCETIKGIKAIGVNFVTIANNHIMDQGEQGLASTVKLLNDNAIAYCGAGNNLQEASQPYIVTVNGKRIGIYCCAEHEFSIAGEKKPGANPFDPLESLDHIVSLKKICDYVLCLYHGGKEYYRYPSPSLQRVCRKIVDKGADLVVCQHSHCIGCEEHYGNGVIVYGQGNFLFHRTDNIYRQTALIVEWQIGDDGMRVYYHPTNVVGEGIALATGERYTDIINQFQKRSREICNTDFVIENYKKFCQEHQWILLQCGGIAMNNIFIRVLNKLCRGHFVKWLANKNYNKKNRLLLKNRIECEAWREIITNLLEE